jgi:hypothetical protein
MKQIRLQIPPTRIPALALMLALFFATGSSLGQSVTSRMEVVEGVNHTYNPESPINGTQEITLQHLWSLGAEDDDDIFGELISAARDEAGNFYLLDSQLFLMRIYSPEGELLTETGREGEGPGEFRQPLQVLPLRDGNVGVANGRPPKVVVYTIDGDPVTDIPIRPSDSAEGGFIFLQDMAVAGDRFISEIRTGRRDEQKMISVTSLAVFSSSGDLQSTLLEHKEERSFGAFTFTDRNQTFAQRRWTLLSNGQAVAALARDTYEIGLFSPEGELTQVLHRESFDLLERTSEELAEMEEAIQMRRGGGGGHRGGGGGGHRGGGFSIEYDFASTHPVLTGFTEGPAGELWVQSCRHDRDLPEGTIDRLEQFNDEGQYTAEILIRTDRKPLRIFYLGEYLILFEEGEKEAEGLPIVSCHRLIR